MAFLGSLTERKKIRRRTLLYVVVRINNPKVPARLR